jgi:hypothetical protein
MADSHFKGSGKTLHQIGESYQDCKSALFQRKRKVFCQNCDAASQAALLCASEKIFVKKNSVFAFLAKNCNEREDAIQAQKFYVSEFSPLSLLRWLYKPT